MQPFSIVFLALSFLCSTLCRVLVTPSSNSSVDSVFSLDIPVRPGQALANIHVDLRNMPSWGSFEPPQMYYNIHTFLVSFWESPHIQPITQLAKHQSAPDLVTSITPVPGSNLFTTAVAASALSKLLEEISTLDWRPRRLAAILETRTVPPQDIGSIVSSHFDDQDLDSITNSTSSPESRRCRDAWLHVSGPVTLRLEFDGQDPDRPPITWATWLEQLTGISSQIFGYHSPDEQLRLRLPLHLPSVKIFSYRKPIRMSSWSLESQIDVTRVPQWKQPLTVDELVQAMTEMLKRAAEGRCFTPLRAAVVKDDWVAATYKLSYTSQPDTGTA